jgi:hypothetical protein
MCLCRSLSHEGNFLVVKFIQMKAIAEMEEVAIYRKEEE